MSREHRLSVVLAVRNGGEYLAAALDSVMADAEGAELVVVDDGSDDETPGMLAGYGDAIVVIRQDPSGQSVAINRGVAVSHGSLLAFQDADDLWPAGRTAALMAALTDEVDGVYGRVEQFFSPDLDPATSARTRLVQVAKPTPLFASSIIRRSAFDTVGPLDTTTATSTIIDWMSRAASAGIRWAQIEDVTLRRRIHATNLGRQVGSAVRNADILKLVRAHVQRGRTTEAAQP